MSETETRDAAVEPTPAQWVDAFMAGDRSEREGAAERAINNARAAGRCFVEGHSVELAQLRRVIDRLTDDRDTQRRTASRLRAVVEAVQALADEWAARAGARSARPASRIDMHEAVDGLRAVLAPVSSSRGAESGVEAVLRVAADYVSDMEAPHPEDFCQKCGGRNVKPWFAPSPVWNAIVGDEWSIICPQCFVELAESSDDYANEAWELRPTIRYTPAPVLSGGQADGEGEPVIPIAYQLGALADWCDSQRTSPTTADLRALAAMAASTAARPVLSRGALRKRLAATLRQNGHVEWTDLDVRNMTEHVLDVLAGGEPA